VLLLVIFACVVPVAALRPASGGEAKETIPIPVSVDIRPGLCPNHLRIESPLTIPIAITASLNFEIERVDPLSVRLIRDGSTAELEPVRWAYADVGTPIVGGLCACHKLRGDGIDDLEFHFSIGDIIRTFELAESSGVTIELSLKGKLMTGEPIEGSDCAVVLGGVFEEERTGEEIYMLTRETEDPHSGPFKFAYCSMVSDRVKFAIHDLKGRTVAVLNDMDMSPGIYTATWDGLNPNKEPAPAGTYFARVSNSFASDITKITLTR
jgi:hypothetical protein